MIFRRKSRRIARFDAWLASPLMPILCAHFDRPDDDGATGGGDTGGAGTSTPAPTPAAGAGGNNGSGNDVRSGQILKERRKFRLALRSLVRGMGLDPDNVKYTETGDPSNPIRIDGIPDLDQRLALARAVGGANLPTGKKGGASAVDLATAQSQRDTFKRQVDALVRYIKRTAVLEPIRAACGRHGAIDDDNGRFDDIVSQLSPMFKVDIDFDPEDASAEPEVSVYAVDANGQPRVTQAGAPATPDFLVLDFLTRRPKYRASNFRGGPGAGGNHVGAAGAAAKPQRNGGTVATVTTPAGARSEDPTDKTRKAVADYFGIDAGALNG